MTILRLEVSDPQFTPENMQTLTVHSSFLNGRADISIYNSTPNSETNLPVIMLLHGVYGHHSAWMQLGGIHFAYEKAKITHDLNDFILVMPSDGGFHDGSAYLPLKEGDDYEKWIIEDVRDAVLKSINGVSNSSQWFISGLSMGGYGALRLGSKYPNLFSGISAHSPITQLEELSLFTSIDLAQYQTRNPEEPDIIYWMRQNKDNLPPIRFDCGYNDILYSGVQSFQKKLISNDIPHQHHFKDGNHEWSYWHKEVNETFLFFDGLVK